MGLPQCRRRVLRTWLPRAQACSFNAARVAGPRQSRIEDFLHGARDALLVNHSAIGAIRYVSQTY